MKRNLLKKIVSVILLLLLVISVGYRQDISVNASESTGIGLASHVIKAHREGGAYVYGNANYGVVDCSELIATYNDVGGLGYDMLESSPCSGQVSSGIPNIHGLGLHQPGHIGVYIGNGTDVDARDESSGIVCQTVSSKRWIEWFKVAGVEYPNTGWVSFDGNAYYYENGEYLVNTTRTINGITYQFASSGASNKIPNSSEFLLVDYHAVSDTASQMSGEPSDSGDYLDSIVYEIGSEGVQVKDLRLRLIELCYMTEEADYYYDKATQIAISEFQDVVGLEKTGKADNITREKLYGKDAPVNPSAGTLKEGAEEEAVKVLQLRLIDLRYTIKEPDGIFDSETAKTVKWYQSASNKEPNGVMKKEDLEVLYSDDAIKSPKYLNLKKRYKGDDVKVLQEKLQTLVVLENQPTDVFEEHTETAVKAVQKEYAQQVTGIASPEFDGLFDSVIFDQKSKQAVQGIIFKMSEISSKALAEVQSSEETYLKDGEFLIEIVWGIFLLFSVAGGALLVFCLRSNPAWLHTVRKKYLRIKQMIKR